MTAGRYKGQNRLRVGAREIEAKDRSGAKEQSRCRHRGWIGLFEEDVSPSVLGQSLGVAVPAVQQGAPARGQAYLGILEHFFAVDRDVTIDDRVFPNGVPGAGAL